MTVQIVLLLLSLCCKYVAAIDIINSANFADTISTQNLVMVLYHAPWNTVSQEFLNEYESIATSLQDVDMFVGKVDVSVEDQLYDTEGIHDLPVIKFYVGGEPIWYEREMDEDSVTGFVRRLTESSLTTLDADAGGFYEFAREHLSETQPIAVMLLGPDMENPSANAAKNNLLTNFDYACKKFFSLPCAVTTNRTLFQNEVSSYPSMVMVRQFPDEASLDIADESITSIDDILYWMQLSAFPRYSEFTQRNEPILYSLKRLGFSTHVITVVDTDIHSHGQGRDITDHSVAAGNTNANVDIFNYGKVMADQYRGQAVFTYVDTARSTEYTEELLDRLEINPALDLPMILIAQAVDTHVNFYAYKSNAMGDIGDTTGGTTSSLTVPQVKDFVSKFFADELFPTSRRRHDLPSDISDLETNGVHPITDATTGANEGLFPQPVTSAGAGANQKNGGGVLDGDEVNAESDFTLEELENDRLLHHLMSF